MPTLPSKWRELLLEAVFCIPVIGLFIEDSIEARSCWHAWERPGRFFFSETEFVMRRKVNGKWEYRPCTASELEEAQYERTQRIAGWN